MSIQITTYESPRMGHRLQIQVDMPTQMMIKDMVKSGELGYYDLIHNVLIDFGPGYIRDQRHKPPMDRQIRVVKKIEVKHLMAGENNKVDDDDVLITVVSEDETVLEIYQLKPRGDLMMLLQMYGRAFMDRVFVAASEIQEG